VLEIIGVSSRLYLMCGRFFLTSSRYELEEFFGVSSKRDSIDDASAQPKFNLPPTWSVPGASIGSDDEMQLDLYRWGFIPNWVTNLAQFKLTTINARSEGVATAKTYRAAFRSQRLLVSATGFFEWDRSNPKKKQPYAFVRNDGAPMAFAGLWDSYLHPDTSEGEHWIRTCTILTTAANEDMPIHDRLPLILERDLWSAWLDPDLQDVNELETMIRVAPTGVLRHYPVDRRVGNVNFDGPACIEPIELEVEQRLL
jgi:putative SOS response-associated peptidase YedK